MMRMKWVGGDTPRGPRDVSGGAKAGEFRPSLALAGRPQSYKAGEFEPSLAAARPNHSMRPLLAGTQTFLTQPTQ